MKRFFLISLLLSTVMACSSNVHDANMAKYKYEAETAKEKAYAAGIEHANKPKLLVRIDGEVRCTPEQIAAKVCGVSFFNPGAQSVGPQRDKNYVDAIEAGVGGVVNLAKALMPVMLAKQAVDLADSVGKSAGGNVTNTDSGNVSEANVTTNTTKTSGGDLADAGSSMDKSVTTTTTSTESLTDSIKVDQGDVTLTTDSQNPVTTDSNDNNSTVDSNDNNSTVTDSNDNNSTVPVTPVP